MTQEILILTLATIGGFLGAFLNSFFKEKGKNYATKSDISKITSQIEDVKQSYNRSLEDYKSSIKTIEDLRSPILTRNKQIDVGLINLLNNLNLKIFEVSQLKKTGSSEDLYSALSKLAEYLVVYKLRYQNVEGVEQIIKSYNFFNSKKVDSDEIAAEFQILSNSTEKVLSNFILPFKTN